MNLEFINILDVEKNTQLDVRNWRNSPNIRKFMYTDDIISEENHKNWLKALQQSNKNIVFVVHYNNESVGIVSVNNIDYKNKNCSWAFYLYPEDLIGKGLGVSIEYQLINYVFDELKMEKLNCEVLEINPSVIKLHKKFGFHEEGIIRKNIIKDGERLDVYLLGLLKEEWQTSKINIERILKRKA